MRRIRSFTVCVLFPKATTEGGLLVASVKLLYSVIKFIVLHRATRCDSSGLKRFQFIFCPCELQVILFLRVPACKRLFLLTTVPICLLMFLRA